MPKATTTSSLAARLGDAGRRGFEASKDTPVNYGGGGQLPDGIENGIAKLVDCRFGVYKDGPFAGKDFYIASGVVVSPEEHDGIPTVGLRTQIMEPLCATPTRSRKTVEEHLDWVLNEWKKLGVDVSGLDYEQLESTAEALKEMGPHFRFRTWKGKKPTSGPYKDQEPRVQEQWKGAVIWEENGHGSVADVIDNTIVEVEETAESIDDSEVEAGEDVPVESVAETDSVELDLSALGASADSGDNEAAARLKALADELDIDSDSAGTWTEVAEAIAETQAPAEETESEPEPEPEVHEPAKGDRYDYKPKLAKKPYECEVKTSNKSKRTVTLFNPTTKKEYKDVSWDDLIVKS